MAGNTSSEVPGIRPRGKRALGMPTGGGVCGARGSTPLSRDIEAVTRSLHVNHISVHANTHRLFTH